MSAAAQGVWRAIDTGSWVDSEAGYLRLVVERRETKISAEFSSDLVATPWSEPEDFSVADTTNDLRSFFETQLKSVPEVTWVKIAERESRHGEKVLHVWTSLTRDDRETRFKVYDVEQDLIRHFPELIFEFHTHLAREDAPDGDTVIYEPTE